MEKGIKGDRRCLRCSNSVKDNQDYCPKCLNGLEKSASENGPVTLREAVDVTAERIHTNV
jgi:predicted amidophosphoribosyltransferase